MSREAESELIYGIHPVGELLEARPAEVERIYATTERRAGLGSLLRRARLAGIPVTHLSRDVLKRRLGARAIHQGVAARVAPVAYRTVDAIRRSADADPAAMLVALDGVVDPQNVGAAVRTCAGAGVAGVILAAEATAGLTGAAVKASAGTVERVPVAREPRLGRLLGELAAGGYRAVGLSARGQVSWDEADLGGRIIIVAGGEQRGLRPAVARACDPLIRIPLAQGVESLNVAVALGVLLFEARRQRRRSGGDP